MSYILISNVLHDIAITLLYFLFLTELTSVFHQKYQCK